MCIYTGWPPKNGTVDTVDFSGLCSDQQLSLFTLLDRACFPHYNNTKIIKFGWKLFILWVISYGLSFSRFARFPEFRGTINDKPMANPENDSSIPARWKRIAVDQSKDLKNRLFRFFWGGHPVANFFFPNRFAFYSVKATCIKTTGIKLTNLVFFNWGCKSKFNLLWQKKNCWLCEDSISQPFDPKTSALIPTRHEQGVAISGVLTE